MRTRITRLRPFLLAGGAALLLVAAPAHHHAGTAAGPSRRIYTIPTPGGQADAGQAQNASSTTVTEPNLLATGGDTPSIGAGTPAFGASGLGATSTIGATPSVATTAATPTITTDTTAVGDVTDIPTPTTTPTPDTPLSVSAHGWATREAGTPVANEGVPTGTLPIGNRAGQIDKASFVKLSGTDSILSLPEDPSGARNLAGDGLIQACSITSDWTGADGASLDQAPAYDTTKCVDGTRGDNGTWTFDLGRFADRSTGYGFALVPAPSAPVDFQVAFSAN